MEHHRSQRQGLWLAPGLAAACWRSESGKRHRSRGRSSGSGAPSRP